MTPNRKQRGDNLIVVMKLFFIAMISVIVAASCYYAYKEPDFRVAMILASIGLVIWAGMIFSMDIEKNGFVVAALSLLFGVYLSCVYLLHLAVNESPTNYLLYTLSFIGFALVAFMSITMVSIRVRPSRR